MRLLFTLILSFVLQFCFANDSVVFRRTVENFRVSNYTAISLWNLISNNYLKLEQDSAVVVDLAFYSTMVSLVLRKDSSIIARDTVFGKLLKHSFRFPSHTKIGGIPGLFWVINSRTNKLIIRESSLICKGGSGGILLLVIMPLGGGGPSWDERFRNSTK